MKKNSVQSKQWLYKHYPGSAPAQLVVTYWDAEFKRGRTSTQNAHHSGSPVQMITAEIISKIHNIILNDQRMLRGIADILNISHVAWFMNIRKCVSCSQNRYRVC